MSKPHIIGISGSFGSGKSTAADFLTTLGYTKISLVQFLEEDLVSREEKNITRKMLQDLGNKWRKEYGRGVLGVRAAEYISEKKLDRVVIEGFRNMGEIEELRKIEEMKLIAIMVNRDIRYKRLEGLDRREKLTPELFEQLDYRDMGVGEGESGLQVAVCIAAADIFLENNTSKEELFQKLSEVEKSL